MFEKKLEEMSMDCIPYLIDKYKSCWPATLHACTFLENLTRWKAKFPDVNIVFLGINGDPRYDTFIALFWAPVETMFFESLNENLNLIKHLLLTSDHIDWTKAKVCGPLRSKYFSIFEEIYQERKLSRLDHDIFTDGYWLDSSAAKKVEIPTKCLDEVYFGEVTESHAELINSLWPHKFEGSLELVNYMLKSHPGVGIFSMDSNELLCWILRDEYGSPGLLQTVEKAKRKGYGSLAVAYITKMYGEENKCPHVYIVKANLASQALFKKNPAGFTQNPPNGRIHPVVVRNGLKNYED